MTLHPSPLASSLAETLRNALAQPPSRILPLSVEGQVYWLKRVEAHRNPLHRLQKGNAGRALAADRAGLAEMARRGLPAPKVLAEGPDFLLTEDVGRPAATWLRDPSVSDDTRHTILSDAARALARLHRAGLCHGRPYLKDICWTPEGGAVFIDFETFSADSGDRAIGRDLLLFLQSVLVVRRARDGFLDTAIDAYRAEAPAQAWEAARNRLHGLRWLMPLAQGVLKVRPRSKEIRAAVELRAVFGL
ncbi:MAG: lipopolysaccharide kinase InaA family protein [Pararhodobacter sp.]